jgi:ABC-type multidrug transport system fused ATPase/permease subunit
LPAESSKEVAVDVTSVPVVGRERSRNRQNAARGEAPKGFMDVARRRTRAFALAAALATLGAALGLVPYALVYLIAVHLFGRPEEAVDAGYVWLLAVGGVVAVVLRALCVGLSDRFAYSAAYDVLYELRMELARKLSELPLGYFDGRATGEIKKVLAEDVEQLEEGLAGAVPAVASAVATPVLTAVVLFFVDWRMALATVALTPVLGLFYGLSLNAPRRFIKEFQEASARLNTVVVQYVQGMRVIKAFARTGSSFEEYRKAVERFSELEWKVSRAAQAPYSAFFASLRANVVIVLPVGAMLFLSGSLSLPTLVLFLLMGMGLNAPLARLMLSAGSLFAKIGGSTRKIVEVLSEEPIPEPKSPKSPDGHDLEFREVSFGYGERRVLENVSFRALEGSVTALVGPSGAGKTTIARLIPRFWDVDAGEIRLGGVDVREIASEELMGRVAFVFQDVFLFDDTVYENVRVGRPSASREEVLDAVRRARVDEFVEALPGGYDTRVGENGARLSGGQRQRVSIARAILKDASLVVLDEATAFVDPENETRIQEAIANLARSKSLVVVAHRLSTITGADQILLVEEGGIAARGTHEELLKSSETYRTLWEAQGEARLRATADVRGGSRPREIPKAAVSGDEVGALPEQPPYKEPPYEGLSGDSFVRAFLRLMGDLRGLFLKRALPLLALEAALSAAPAIFVFMTLSELFREEPRAGLVYLYAGGLLVCSLAQGLSNYLAFGVLYRLNIEGKRNLRLYIGERLSRLPLGFFARRDTGGLSSLIVDDIWTGIDFVTPPGQFARAVVGPAVILAVLAVVDWRMALAAVAFVPFFALVLLWGDRIFKEGWSAVVEARSEANSRIVEYVRGIPVIRAFDLGGERWGRFERAMDDHRRASNFISKVTPAQIAGTTALELGFPAIVAAGAALYLAGSLELSVYLLFLVVGLVFYAPILDAGDLISYRRMMQASMRKVSELLDTPLLPEPKADRKPQDHSIEFDRVSFGYEQERVLTEVSVRIPERGMTALVGPSGSGKTTITSLIARFWDVDEGAVKVGGADVRDMKTDTLMARITMVFQDVYLFNDTIFDNIRFGNPNATKGEVVAAAKAARCHEFIVRLPQGYDTVVGEGGSTLSGGEKQRISIARALLKDAPIVLLDEATASIDPENERLIQDALNSLVAEKTLVVIAHRLSTVRSADKILVLGNGQILQEGPHEELIAQDGTYRRFWDERERARDWKLGCRDRAENWVAEEGA